MEKNVFEKVLAGERVAGCPTHYYILKQRYPTANVAYLRNPEDYRYVLLDAPLEAMLGKRMHSYPYKTAADFLRDYDVVYDNLPRPSRERDGFRVWLGRGGFGGVLFKRKTEIPH